MFAPMLSEADPTLDVAKIIAMLLIGVLVISMQKVTLSNLLM
jgi:hypothetical protein